jgi:hypothetical protein
MDKMIRKIFDKNMEFDKVISYLRDMEISLSLNITDIISIIVNHIVENQTFDVNITANILIELEETEHNMSIGATSYIQLCNVASIIKRLGNDV